MEKSQGSEVSSLHHILIVDDESTMQRLLKRILESHGFSTQVASNGKEALSCLKAGAVDLVITDVDMPVMDGLTLTKEVVGTLGLDVIIITGKIDQYSYDQVVTIGASDYIQKPFSAEEIILRVRRVIRERFLKDEAVRLQQEQDRAHRFEAIGQLAAGIAHEINTPIQYIGDNVNFIKESFQDLLDLVDSLEPMLLRGSDPVDNTGLKIEFDRLAKEADMAFLSEEVPVAIDQTLEGVTRIKQIIRAMKRFSHPGKEDHTMANLNHCLESTIIISKNEWKYVAEIELDLDENLPEINCNPGELNQVFLNLIVNASHAIEEKMQTHSPEKGVIRISTRSDREWVEIVVEDTGAGIPDEVAEKIFDPFFTTKEPGKGTGQGLAIVRSIVVQHHKGKIEVETSPDKGSCFFIRLPILHKA